MGWLKQVPIGMREKMTFLGMQAVNWSWGRILRQPDGTYAED